MQNFGRNAQRLARNPLGIIALFIVLVYGIAGMVFGVSLDRLESSERLTLILFLVIFPAVVLAVFYRLVSVHHVKLYAPRDFPDSDGFFRALTPGEQRERLNQEIQEMESDGLASDDDSIHAVDMEGTGISREAAVRHTWTVAEDLAFRELEREFGGVVRRQGKLSEIMTVDGVIVGDDRLTVVEVKFARRAPLIQAARHATEHLARIAKRLRPAPPFILAIVHERMTAKTLSASVERVQEHLDSTPFPVELRIYDFDELKEKYGIAGPPAE